MLIMQKLLRLVRRAFHCVRTRSIKAVFKKHWHKVLSVVCAVGIILMVGVSAFAFSLADVGDVVELVEGLLDVYGTCKPFFDECGNALHADSVASKAYYLTFWKDFIVKSGYTESDFREVWEWIVLNGDNTEYQTQYSGLNDVYIKVIETVASGVSLDYICNAFYRDNGLDDFKVTEDNKLQLSSKAFKDMVSDYNSRYAPMPTQTMWKWSYQTELSYKPAKSATPYIPIFWSNYGAWGGKDGSWKECYVLPFLTDDDVDAPYYMNYYYHFYPTFDDDHTPYINVELYSLIDNQLYNADSWSFAFKSGTFEGKNAVFALNLLGYRNAPNLYGYTSDVGYLTVTTESGKFTYSQISRNSGGYFFSGGALSNLTLNKYLNDLISESTFTPDTATGDDWGAYISQTPFQLWGNQTTVDWDRVPDNYYITIQGDNFYDYSIHNPDTGDECPFGDFLIDYDIPDLVDPDEGDDDNSGGSGGGSVSGEINVGGKVDVSGDIVIKADPIDINVNVNTSGGSSGAGTAEGVLFDEDLSLNNYYGWMQDQTTGFGAFMKAFFGWLPEPIVIMLCAGFALVILARFLGR